MKSGVRTDLIIVSIIISIVAHIATMIYAHPKVMTHVAAGIQRVTRRGPMKVSEVPERPEPVRIDTVKDTAADRAAPEAETPTTAVPASEGLLPPSADKEIAVPDVLMPEVSTTDIPVDRLPELISSTTSPIVAPETQMITEMTTPPESAGLLHMPTIPTSDLQLAPGIDLPVGLPVEAMLPTQVKEEIVVLEPEKKDDKPDFVPAPEVMAGVDEKVVEAEKTAVSDLINASDAADLKEFVSLSLTSAQDADYAYFQVSVRPNPSLPTIPKDVVVLIDASGSIGRDRMASIRVAAKKILRSAANTGDRFNLVAFRDRFSYAFKTWQDCTVASFDRADKWLNNVAPFGRTDVFSTIRSVLTLPRDPKRPLVALVVTDGDANAGVSSTSSILSKFTRLNDGLVSVYMYGVKSSANRELIDVLTRGNRGDSFIFEGSAWRAGSGIEELSNRFRDPVLSDLRLVFTASCPAEAYPRLLKNLYRGESVEIVGRVPLGTRDVSFSLKGLNGSKAYEGFFRLPIESGAFDNSLKAKWANDHAIDLRLR